jgi:hypothetical protein
MFTVRVALVMMGMLLAVPCEGKSPAIVEAEIKALLNQQSERPADHAVLLRLSERYLDLGDELTDDIKRREAYEAGAATAKRALELQENNAQAHYLYAANLGSAVRLTGVMAGAVTVNEIKRHVRRALALRDHHAPSLHMMGMLLEELPWILGGDRKAALQYLEAAVSADSEYLHARLDLAKAYLKRNDPKQAARHLAVLADAGLRHPEGRARRYVDEGRQLLEGLNEGARH